MARGIQTDGYGGPIFGLGEHDANRTSAAAVANYHRGGFERMNNPSPDIRAQYPSVIWDRVNMNVEQQRQFPWPIEMRACGGDNGVPCTDGQAVSSLSGGLGGLGDVTDFLCSEWAGVMNQLGTLLTQAESSVSGINSQQYIDAKSYYDAHTGLFSSPFLSSTCQQETSNARNVYNALSSALGSGGNINNIVPPGANGGSGSNINDAIKWGAIGLVALAGAYALGPIFRGLGGLIGRKK